MNSLIMGLLGLVLGAVGLWIFNHLTKKKDIYVKYDQKKIDEIETRADEILKEVQRNNAPIRTRDDAIKELNRYRNIN